MNTPVHKELTVAARPSRLSLAQVKELFALYPGLAYRLVPVDSFGDTRKDIPLIDGNAPSDIFTRELDQALLEGKADIAVHSAKDLPVPLRAGLEIIALTASPDPSDALVSRDGVRFADLPHGARVGTSSPSRRDQLKAARPGLTIVPVRGTIDERLGLVDRGEIDALIVAACALKRLGLGQRIAEILPFASHPLQGSIAVVARSGRPDLRELFREHDILKGYGKVYLVGGGPGDPELITVKAARVLERADVIYYDDLIGEEAVNAYPARKVYVGKRKGDHAFPQDEICEMIYRDAAAGACVARLKGGDPFIFGRGGEELRYLAERLVDVEVIPGISAAQCAAASARIPLTLRGVSGSVSFLSAHPSEEITPGRQVLEDGTIVFYMGATRIEEIKAQLAAYGKRPGTPVALVESAGLPAEMVTVKPLAELKEGDAKSPVIVIAGDVVNTALPRNRILFTGLDPVNCPVKGQIVNYPLIAVQPLPFAADLAGYDAVIFTSKMSARYFCDRCPPRAETKTVAIGPVTKRELERRGWRVDHMPDTPDSDDVAALVERLGFK
ncbi:MAG TPA: uroporphyrinogen-III C-methyltransferase [bacterium]|nr:uroporphyrinogen-III C-methyltransferase [bacterium]